MELINSIFKHDIPRFDTYSYLGSDAPDVVGSGRSQDNVFENTTIIGGLERIKLIHADGTQFTDNTLDDATTIRFNDGQKTVMTGKIGLKNSNLQVTNGAYFDLMPDYGLDPII